MVEARFAPEVVAISSEGRITLPQLYCDKIPWVRGDQVMRVRLLELAAGRFRLLSDQEVQENEQLSEIRTAIVDGPGEPNAAPTTFASNEIASLVGRLVPTTLSPPRPTWRLVVPRRIAPEQKDKLVLLFSLGYLEIWHLDIYNAAVGSPLDTVIWN